MDASTFDGIGTIFTVVVVLGVILFLIAVVVCPVFYLQKSRAQKELLEFKIEAIKRGYAEMVIKEPEAAESQTEWVWKEVEETGENLKPHED